MLSASSPYRQQGDDTQYDEYGNIIPRQQSRDLQPYHVTNPQQAQQQYLSTLASNYAGSPSGPIGQAYQPVAQAPRGQIESSGPANYGSSPSNPNWGQESGGSSIQKMGPTNVPASTNYSAISPSNRIAGNISAVMSGRQGPSPGTSPYLNQSGRLESPPNARPWTGFGPTGQPVPSRQPVQKNDPRG